MIRTRFAPSPTGYLHIGGVRTALFNWLFARKNEGQFILRIDDTDQGRHMGEAIQPILDGFEWLGMDIDEGPIYQSERTDLYREAVRMLLNAGHLYRDYTTTEDRGYFMAEHQKLGTGKPYRFRGRELPDSQRALLDNQKHPYVLRFKVPLGRSLVINDVVRGTVTVNTEEIGDFVVARADGSPLYNLATTIDDHSLKITHVIRAEEHLTNTFPQMLIYEAMGWSLPMFAHVPFVTAPERCKEKLSKRHGAVGLSEFKELGYLPETIINYLVRLGWSFDDKKEFFSKEELIRDFSLERVVNSPACHNPPKLFSYQGHWMSLRSLEDRVALTSPLIEAACPFWAISDEKRQSGAAVIYLTKVIECLGNRLKLPSDALKYGRFFFEKDCDYEFEQEWFQKRIIDLPEGMAILEDLGTIFSDWVTDPLMGEIHEQLLEMTTTCANLAERHKVKTGDVNHVLRLAITGQHVGPGAFDCALILGFERSRDRISRAIRHVHELKLKGEHSELLRDS